MRVRTGRFESWRFLPLLPAGRQSPPLVPRCSRGGPQASSLAAQPSPFQAQGEISPGKNALLHCTAAGSTPLPLDHESFAVSGPLALVGNAFYPVLVHRLAASLHASSPHSVALMQLRFTSLTVTSSREDLHLQDRAHAGRTLTKRAARAHLAAPLLDANKAPSRTPPQLLSPRSWHATAVGLWWIIHRALVCSAFDLAFIHISQLDALQSSQCSVLSVYCLIASTCTMMRTFFGKPQSMPKFMP